MNFRLLIEQAMNEASDEFAAIVARKLDAALIGRAEGQRPRHQGRPPARKADRPRAAGGRSKQRRAAPEHMASLQEKILHG